MSKINKVLIVSGTILGVVSPIIYADGPKYQNEFREEKANAKFGKGLRTLSKDEDEILTKRKIKNIKPNQFAKQRAGFKGETEELGSSTIDEFSFSEGQDKTTLASFQVNEIDNSQLSAFPLIGNQSGQNSCAAWAATYYLMSHEYCLTNGCDNKNYQEKVFSPKWTYNLINSGVDNGAYFSDAFQVMNHHGAVTNSDFPYGTDFRSWSVDSEHWRQAINHKMSPLYTMGIGTDSEMDLVKQTLLNGHVVVVGTYINSWIYKTVGTVPNVNSPFVGESIAIAMNGTLGGHAMTIVGYNDDIWTDINANGLVEQSEKGAFKIANSWGTTWRNKGFVWASYEAFRITPTVPSFSLLDRLPLAKNSGNKVLTATFSAQTPKAFAKFNISHAKRNQISFNLGTSTLTQTAPAQSYNPYAFNLRGGTYAFDGSNTETDATFYLDASSLVSSDITNTKFYLKVSDALTGDPLTVNSFQIVNPNTDELIYNSSIINPTIDATNSTLIAKFEDIELPSTPANLSATLKTVKSGRKVTYYARLTWSAAVDNVGIGKYIIFRNGVKFAETTNLTFEDAKTSANVLYTYQIQSVDTSGNLSALSSAIQFKR